MSGFQYHAIIEMLDFDVAFETMRDSCFQIKKNK